jgi:drug/metabolite transporter (DMT)-like permease
MTARPRSLLILLVVTWAISWPVVKVGVGTVPPIWFACLRYAIAAACLFVLAAALDQLIVPPRSDWPLVAVSGGLQMATFSALTGLALTVLPPGRASVLAFSTPIWVVPLAARWLNERASLRAWLGVALGLSGVVALAAPALRANGTGAIGAYAMLVGAAAAWAISIVFVRAHRFTASALALAPWQALVAAGLLLPIAIAVHGPRPPIDARGLAALGYAGPIATAFAYWAVVEVGRQVRASAMSMALLLTPSLGISISAITLGEPIGPSLAAGVALIGAGVRLASTGR